MKWPEVGDSRDEDVTDGVELDITNLFRFVCGADNVERASSAPIPEVELIMGSDHEKLNPKKKVGMYLLTGFYIMLIYIYFFTKLAPPAFNFGFTYSCNYQVHRVRLFTSGSS